jgi:ethanolamine utilization protein EutJ
MDPSGSLLEKAAAAFETAVPVKKGEHLYCGVDLGTASIILVALNGEGKPIACEMEPCQVARDGLVVDYMGAIAITKRLRERLESRIGARLETAGIAVPPGTNKANSGTHRNVVEASGMEVAGVFDEPTAANAVLRVKDGVVVDIGGGTTGLSVFKGGHAIYTADEATGGRHMSLVLMGRYKMSYEEAEAFKQDPKNADEVRAAVLPVAEKMASIVARHIGERDVDEVWLVGGATCLRGIEDVFSETLGKRTFKPTYPMMVTPLGIAMSILPGEVFSEC